MMTGGAFGSLIGGWVYGLVGPYGWRWVFFVGIAPAILLAFIRRGMVEPEHFEQVGARRRCAKANAAAVSDEEREFLRFLPVQLFTRRNRYSTFVGHGQARRRLNTGTAIPATAKSPGGEVVATVCSPRGQRAAVKIITTSAVHIPTSRKIDGVVFLRSAPTSAVD